MSDERDMRIIAEIGRRNGVVNEHTRQQAVLEAARALKRRLIERVNFCWCCNGGSWMRKGCRRCKEDNEALARFDAAMKEAGR